MRLELCTSPLLILRVLPRCRPEGAPKRAFPEKSATLFSRRPRQHAGAALPRLRHCKEKEPGAPQLLKKRYRDPLRCCCAPGGLARSTASPLQRPYRWALKHHFPRPFRSHPTASTSEERRFSRSEYQGRRQLAELERGGGLRRHDRPPRPLQSVESQVQELEPVLPGPLRENASGHGHERVRSLGASVTPRVCVAVCVSCRNIWT